MRSTTTHDQEQRRRQARTVILQGENLTRAYNVDSPDVEEGSARIALYNNAQAISDCFRELRTYIWMIASFGYKQKFLKEKKRKYHRC